MRSFKFIVCLLLASSSLFALRGEDLFLRFPLTNSLPSSSSSWLSQVMTQDLTGYEIFQAKVLPPRPDSSLALTVFFQEKELKTIRILWISSAGLPQIICENISEGTLLQNQRTVVIPSSLLTIEGGTLLIQADDITLDVQALHFQWTSSTSLLVTDPTAKPALLTPQGVLRSEEISGKTVPEKSDLIQGTISSTPLVTTAEPLEAASYGVELSQIPNRARIEVEVQGLPVNETLRLQINGVDLGPVAIEIPSLTSTGYLSYKTLYWGWRKGALWVPSTALQLGVNTVELSTPSHRALSIKNLIIETDYRPEPPPEALPESQP